MKKVMVFGTFDILHLGHIHLLNKAKEYGDVLLVVVARNKNVEKIKGQEPLHDENERKLILENLKMIDKVVFGYEDDVYEVIKEYQPDTIALGYDQKVFVDELEDAITRYGLSATIVRLPPFYPEKYKSQIMRKYIEKAL